MLDIEALFDNNFIGRILLVIDFLFVFIPFGMVQSDNLKLRS